MTRAGVTPAAADGVIGKAALCEALGWTRPRLDRRLDSDESFPVARRGTRAGGWEFDLAAVQSYLSGGTPAPASAKRAAKSGATKATAEAANQYPGAKYTQVPPAGVEPLTHSGEQTARQRRDMVQAEILEDQLRRNRGELVQAEVVRQMLTTMLVHLGQGLDRMSDLLVKRLQLPEQYSDEIRLVTDDLRVQMAAELRMLLG